MSRTPTPQLTKMFTYAESSYSSSSADLIFAGATGVKIDAMMEIAEDPLVVQTLGYPFLVMECPDAPYLLATIDFEHILTSLDSAQADVEVVFTTEKETRRCNLVDIFYKCSLPHKLIVGCVECISDKQTVGHCFPKAALLQMYTDGTPENAADIDDMDDWQHRKLHVAGFTYISPMLTAPKNIAKKQRPISEHDFSFVEERSRIRSDAMVERHRRQRFKKKECLRCFGNAECRSRDWNRYQWCKGPYLYTEKEATKRILESVRIPFNNTQLRYLLNNSGPLAKRYNRCKYVATFFTRYDVLRFGIKRRTQPDSNVIPFDNYREAQTFLSKYSENETAWPKPSMYGTITAELKARLCLLAQYDYGPYTAAGYYGHCSYPSMWLNRYGNRMEQFYGQRRGDLHWVSRKLDTIADVLRTDVDIPYLTRTKSADSPEMY